jgi:predicted dehydrogenase
VGQILGGTVSWLGGRLWYKTRNPGESDASYMTRNWVSFAEMSGDHIVEQHVHNIDVANWFLGSPPIAALGFGGRARRETGNQFDFFSVDYTYPDGVHIHSMCRQVNGCYSRVGELFRTTKGTMFGAGKMKLTEGGTFAFAKEYPEHEGPYVQEHVDMLDSIVKGEPMNEAQVVAEATMAGIMGRISAYTGQLVRWSDVMQNKRSAYYDLTMSPAALDFETGNVTAPQDDVVPVPGKV